MSVQAMTRVMEHSQTRGVTRLVLLVIANHETEDRGAFPAIDRLARESGTGVRTVQECIRRAAAAGELAVEYRAGPHGTNVYRTLCGLNVTAILPGTESTRIRTPQNPHPADVRRESAPERKEQGLGLSVASSSSQPTSTPLERRRVEKIGKPRKADPVFDALAELHGGTPNLTRQAAATIGTAAAGIRAAMPDVTAEEVERRAGAYRLLSWNRERAFPSATALAKWWPVCVAVEPARGGLGAELLIEEQMRGSSG